MVGPQLLEEAAHMLHDTCQVMGGVLLHCVNTKNT
jgi:hypothetical protein